MFASKVRSVFHSSATTATIAVFCSAERAFAQGVFHPVLDRTASEFNCNDGHRYFAASLICRVKIAEELGAFIIDADRPACEAVARRAMVS